ncbi:MAG TPA: hypothetical protein VK116_20070, partial [Planctomycetota bacterium]|nr:hypothetical protein [Planctomycetota bacterium]
MNWLVSVVLLAVGVVLLFLLASGACVAAPVSSGASSAWEAVLEPLWNFDVVGASALFVAGLSICLGIAIPVWTTADRGRPTIDAARWSSVLLVAFLLNTFVSALCLLLLSLAW